MYNTSTTNPSVSMPISDDDSDEYSGRIRRPRARRKRNKFRSKTELTRRLVRQLAKWWPLIVFLLAMALLVFEASRLGRRPSRESSDLSSEFTRSKPGFAIVKNSNLNRLDHTYHTVAGVKERCLPLLPPEELDHLDIPVERSPIGRVKNVVYITEDNNPYSRENSSLSEQEKGSGRFNLFTGYQTLQQRKRSFEVIDTPMVHCGFYSGGGGFKISDEDKKYMQTCKAVVSTCAFGGGDDLYQPIGMSNASLQKVCYVAFWDAVTLSTQETQGNKVGENHYIGKWRVVIVNNLPFADQRLNGKIPKMLAHRLFPNAQYSIWVDSKSQFRRDPLGVLEALLWRSKSVIAISQHGARSSVYDEAKAVVKKNKATPEEVEVQITQYHHDGLPEDKRFNGKKALAEASIIVREHTPLSNMFMCLWFNEVVRFTSRDQLSFPYVLWRLKIVDDINMFPVCTRKDLVNSMGHIRKAKPLVK
ncbi:putative hexosyltransferase MUCI70 [Silene latifolia]|uniref:putative hexosyltransferase MUCI70 n=1 Tax=Silene latifolia TaxID=37657 RepID=UPI003D77CE64